jgi:pectinesterase
VAASTTRLKRELFYTKKMEKKSFMITSRWAFFQYLVFLWLLGTLTLCAQTTSCASKMVEMFPANATANVNPDTHLELTFHGIPIVGTKGQIRIYDKADSRLVDSLDMSIPPGPTRSYVDGPAGTGIKAPYIKEPYQYISGKFTNANTKPGTPSCGAAPTADNYQLTIIGGFTDGFHFFPVIVHDNTATIYLHNNLLEYNKTYYVQIDPNVFTLSDSSFRGIAGKTGWIFTTKKLPPPANLERLVVSADGSGDFNTVQGAIDFIPDENPKHVTIFIKNGTYEEIVYFRNKSNITILGEDRDNVIIKYANKETFNPHPSNISTNEVEGTFPYRRAAFAVDHSSMIHLVNLTIKTTSERAQAEGLLLNGSENIIDNVTIGGSGDALQSNGSAYYTGCRIQGWGDMVLGRGPAFFKDCDLSAEGPYMWVRNTFANHGDVFVNCKFMTPEGKEAIFARAPTNGGKNYPYAEAVLLQCKIAGIAPVGWGTIGGDSSNVHYWEYNSTNISDGKPADVSRRHPASRQLTMKNDSAIIASYTDPAYILGGWTPSMVPIILSQPKSLEAKIGESASFKVAAAAIPEANYQWFFNGQVISGATNATLNMEKLSTKDAGTYRVVVKNSLGSVTSDDAILAVE